MFESVLKKSINLGMALATVALVGCSGGGSIGVGGSIGGGGYGGGGSGYGSYTSPGATADSFVSGLNNVDGAASSVVLYEDETYRTYVPGQEEWFVIWDDKWNEYKAVSLQYIRSIVYYDYYSNSTALAAEFRGIENDDIFVGNSNGDPFGNDYEVVDYDPFTDSYFGRNSGFEYEDEAQTRDVSLMAAEKEKKEFFQKAANISYTYNLNLETSMSLVTLGKKVEKMMDKGQGDITAKDQQALLGDIEKLTGAKFTDMVKAVGNNAAKEDLIEKVSKKVGTTSANLENKILPELFGLNL